MTNIEDVKKEYLQLLEIDEKTAQENADYVIKYVVAEDETGVQYNRESMRPLVKVIEYVINPEHTYKVAEYIQENGKEPEWANSQEWGMNGEILPYLAETPVKYASLEPNIYFAVAMDSEVKDKDNKPAIMMNKLTKIMDFGNSGN